MPKPISSNKEGRRQQSQVPAWSPQHHALRRTGRTKTSTCRRELDLHVGNGEVLQHSLSHRLHAARRAQRHIPVRRAKVWHQADLFGSAPAKDLPEAEAILDAIGESDSVPTLPTRVGLEVAIVLSFIVRIAFVDVGRACDFEFSTGHML